MSSMEEISHTWNFCELHLYSCYASTTSVFPLTLILFTTDISCTIVEIELNDIQTPEVAADTECVFSRSFEQGI